ncbi:MAG: M23 family metallopeptidase [Rubricoccaceae bacterium]|nr:M23 family metallopeptidase [Rubricoccaceae bacterium]
MPKNSYYYYDHEACTFVEVEPDRARWLVRGGLVVALALVFAAAGVWAVSSTSVSPEEIAQRQEIEVLRDQLASANAHLTSFSDQLQDLADHDRELYRTVFEADPISEDEFALGVGGARTDEYDRYSAPTATLLRNTSETFDRLGRQLRLQSRSFEELERLARARSAEIRQQPAILPLRGARLTSGFGMRRHPILRTVRMHNGVDFPTPIGTPIYATADGEVGFVGTRGGYGNVVEVRHPLSNRMTRYAHLSRPLVAPGEPVSRGQLIGYSGNTGLSTAPHLHYEVRRLADDEPLNPVATFVPGVSAREYQELLEAAQLETASFD